MDNSQHETQHKLVGRTLTDYLLYFPALTISGLMGLVTVAVLSKFFSPANYGQYTLAISTLLLLSMVTGLWLRSSVLRLLPQYTASNQAHEFIGTLLGAGTFVVLAVMMVYGLVIFLFRPRLDAQLYQLLWIVVFGVPILTIFTVLQESHRIQGRSALYSGLILLRVGGAFLVGLFLAIILGWGPVGMLLGLIIVIIGAIGGHVFWVSRSMIGEPRKLRWSGKILRDMMAFSLPIVGLNLASAVLAVSDRYLIEAYLSSYDLGIYSATYALAEGGMRLIANTFLVATQPIIFNTWVTEGPQVTFQFIERLFRYYVILALPVLVGLSLLGDKIVTLFTTPEYAAGSGIMIFVSIALFLHGYSLIVGTVFDATKRTMIPLVLFIIAGLSNVLLNILLLPQFGYMAAAWSTCAGYALLLGLHVIAARRIVRLHVVGRYLWKVGLASAGMGGFLLVAQLWISPSILGLLSTIILAALVYGFLVLALGGISPIEKQVLIVRFKRIFSRLPKPVFMSKWSTEI